jgi:hypothetical protein
MYVMTSLSIGIRQRAGCLSGIAVLREDIGEPIGAFGAAAPGEAASIVAALIS